MKKGLRLVFAMMCFVVPLVSCGSRRTSADPSPLASAEVAMESPAVEGTMPPALSTAAPAPSTTSAPSAEAATSPLKKMLSSPDGDPIDRWVTYSELGLPSDGRVLGVCDRGNLIVVECEGRVSMYALRGNEYGIAQSHSSDQHMTEAFSLTSKNGIQRLSAKERPIAAVAPSGEVVWLPRLYEDFDEYRSELVLAFVSERQAVYTTQKSDSAPKGESLLKTVLYDLASGAFDVIEPTSYIRERLVKAGNGYFSTFPRSNGSWVQYTFFPPGYTFWDVVDSSGTVTTFEAGQFDAISNVRFSSDENLLAFVYSEMHLAPHVFDLTTGDIYRAFTFPEEGDFVPVQFMSWNGSDGLFVGAFDNASGEMSITYRSMDEVRRGKRAAID